jgi:hypothetical protein
LYRRPACLPEAWVRRLPLGGPTSVSAAGRRGAPYVADSPRASKQECLAHRHRRRRPPNAATITSQRGSVSAAGGSETRPYSCGQAAVWSSPPWRAPLCTPLERGWIELPDIETARFSVASLRASALESGFKLAEAGLRSDAEAPCNWLCFPFHPRRGGVQRTARSKRATGSHVTRRGGGQECPPHHEAPPLATLNSWAM